MGRHRKQVLTFGFAQDETLLARPEFAVCLWRTATRFADSMVVSSCFGIVSRGNVSAACGHSRVDGNGSAWAGELGFSALGKRDVRRGGEGDGGALPLFESIDVGDSLKAKSRPSWCPRGLPDLVALVIMGHGIWLWGWCPPHEWIDFRKRTGIQQERRDRTAGMWLRGRWNGCKVSKMASDRYHAPNWCSRVHPPVPTTRSGLCCKSSAVEFRRPVPAEFAMCRGGAAAGGVWDLGGV